MRQLAIVYSTMLETFRLQRRDKIFVPAAVTGFGLLMFANLASSWGIENYSKILFNVGTAGFHFTGAMVALLWGSKLLSDSRSDGSIEIQLAGPINRSAWLVGKYLGLVLSLSLLGLILVGAWQVLFLATDLTWLRERDLVIFGMYALEWFLIGAIAFFFASFSSSAITLFSTVCLWLAGLSSAVASSIMPPQTSAAVQQLIEFIARYWNLQQFNLAAYALTEEFLSHTEIGERLAYGFLLIAILITAAAVIFKRRSLI